jgi:hypothetical protein
MADVNADVYSHRTAPELPALFTQLCGLPGEAGLSSVFGAPRLGAFDDSAAISQWRASQGDRSSQFDHFKTAYGMSLRARLTQMGALFALGAAPGIAQNFKADRDNLTKLRFFIDQAASGRSELGSARRPEVKRRDARPLTQQRIRHAWTISISTSAPPRFQD